MTARITPFAATCMVVANMIGVGVFTSVGFQIGGLPSAAPVLSLWLIGGVLSLCGALCYAELVATMPRSGGEYHLLREAYHPLVGFMAGWISLVAGFSAPIALAASAFAKYAQHFGVDMQEQLLAAALVTFMTAMNLTNDRWFGRILGGFTVLKVFLILAFIAGAVFLPGGVHNDLLPKAGDEALDFAPAFAISLVYVMYAFEGWNGAAYVAGEVQEPQKNMPRALITGTIVVTLLYVALNAVFLWRAPWDQMQNKPEAALIAAQSIFGVTGGKFMGFLIAFGLISTGREHDLRGLARERTHGRGCAVLEAAGLSKQSRHARGSGACRGGHVFIDAADAHLRGSAALRGVLAGQLVLPSRVGRDLAAHSPPQRPASVLALCRCIPSRRCCSRA